MKTFIRRFEGKHHFKWLARCDGPRPTFHHRRQGIRINHRFPSPALDLLGSSPSVFVASLIIPVDPSVTVRQPHQLRHEIRQQLKLSFPFQWCIGDFWTHGRSLVATRQIAADRLEADGVLGERRLKTINEARLHFKAGIACWNLRRSGLADRKREPVLRKQRDRAYVRRSPKRL